MPSTVGKYLGEKLEEIKARHPSVGDVRYIGLFSTLELVANRESKEIMPASVMGEVGKVLRENGLFTFIMANNMGSMVFVVPPLCITKEQLDEGLAIVEKALEVADKQVKCNVVRLAIQRLAPTMDGEYMEKILNYINGEWIEPNVQ